MYMQLLDQKDTLKSDSETIYTPIQKKGKRDGRLDQIETSLEKLYNKLNVKE